MRNFLEQVKNNVDLKTASLVVGLPVVAQQVHSILTNGDFDTSTGALSVLVSSLIAGVLVGKQSAKDKSDLSDERRWSENKVTKQHGWKDIEFSLSLDGKVPLGLPHVKDWFLINQAKILAKECLDTKLQVVKDYKLAEPLGSYFYMANRHIVHVCIPVFQNGEIVSTLHRINEVH